MTLIEKQELFNLWNRTEKGGLLRVMPEENNRERGSPMSDPLENWWLLRRLEENIQDEGPILTILELGVADGGGAKIWEQVLLTQLKYTKNRNNPKELLYIGVDWSPNILWDYKNSPIDMRIISNDTHKQETREQVKQILIEKGNRKVDFLWIDAQHHSEDVKRDFEDFGSFVKDNGIIGFHDTRLCREMFDKFLGATGIAADDNPRNIEGYKSEKAIFHKEEIKYSLGTGIFWKTQDQTVVKFRDI